MDEVDQESPPRSFADEWAPEPEEHPRRRYNIPLGSGGINISAGMKSVYVDNVFLTQSGARDDFVLVPKANLDAYFPLGLSNAVVVNLGLAYYQYLKNTSLNTGTPLINPNSEVAFNIRTGDFTVKVSEQFSYQESPVYEEGAEFFNVYDTGRLGRFDNRVGALATWDLHQLLLDLGYYHENLLANGSAFDEINHASELVNADAMFALSPDLKAGLETTGSINRFDPARLNDSWRATAGPGARWQISKFLEARAGAGYERIQYDGAEASALGIQPQNAYYAYGTINHKINRFFSQSLRVSHDNQLGYNSGNLEGTHLVYSLTWRPQDRLNVRPLVSFDFFNETFGSGPPSLYHEQFTYLLAGLSARYELGRHWQAGLDWSYRLKDSRLDNAGYAQNEAALELLYNF